MASLNGFASHRLGPRVPALSMREALAEDPTQVIGSYVASRVYQRAAAASTSKCSKTTDENEDLCEKPVGGSMTTAIVVPVVVALVAIICTLVYLHRRGVKRVQQEDMDAHKSMDFGMTLEAGGKAAKPKRKSAFFGAGEKDPSAGGRHRQLSMDMNLSSPYLLPPEIQQSRESLNSLARTIHQHEDPYFRPVTQYIGSDAGSVRTYAKDRSSAFTSNLAYEVPQTPRLDSMPKLEPVSPGPRSPAPPPYPSSPVMNMPSKPPPVAEPFNKETAISELDSGSTIGSDSLSEAPGDIQVPPKVSVKGAPVSPGQTPSMVLPELASHQSMAESDELFIYDTPGAGLPKDTPSSTVPPKEPKPRGESATIGQFAFEITPLAADSKPTIPALSMNGGFNFNDDAPQQDNRALHRRQSSEYPQDDMNLQPSGLGLPEVDSKRLSVGFRPLPPDQITELEDPETRANRIRSFYKEYFEEKPDMTEYNQHYPPNGIPAEYRNNANPPPPPRGRPQYQENHNQNFGESAAYFDPESNTFVMPYAQPVSRRAMTPPPSGSRFPGGRPGPRKYSMSGMSAEGGPRPGSSVSNMRSASAMGGPRAPSNMSGQVRKPIPPPADLITLPTPSMLKDDGIALLGALDFAPPPSMAEHVGGRSQSPLGERRPYSPHVPVSTPLVSSFDEMAALPSPFQLRKSSTFTSLDFLPPRKFQNADTMSDAGSIRSNGSGISSSKQAAIRNGAGRVSRLPGDTVFTSKALGDTLKPQWGMRP